ncbi:MAG: HesA/MoeB/ThiF family protein [bacterium]|jgi:molybdopterin/thiamine biosynthesis adenylyltransferase|nr:molybdopterin-synthase adenylyltransferase MoeB [Betaproteobacteria bacterium]
MDDDQLTRYSRHILLDEIGIDGQQRLLDSRVLLVGAGGLGSPVALYLASAGVGEVTVCDADHVDLTNLQRQVAHTTQSVGMQKVASIARAMQAINPSTRVVALAQRLEGEALLERVGAADIVVDASDNFPTRHALNAACVHHRRPLVSGAAIRFDGQVSVFDLRHDDGPCYHCLFPQVDADGEADERCAVMGVFAPLVGVIGAMQAAEALKLAAGVGRSLSGRLLLFSARESQWREVRVKRDPACSVCGGRAREGA